MGLHVAHRMDTDMLEEGLVWRVPRGSDRGGQDVAAEQEDSNCGVESAVYSDHIHLSVRIPPKYSVVELMGYLKVISALMLLDRHPEWKAPNRLRQGLLGKRVLCEHDWLERGCDQEVHPEPRGIGQDRRRHVRRAP